MSLLRRADALTSVIARIEGELPVIAEQVARGFLGGGALSQQRSILREARRELRALLTQGDCFDSILDLNLNLNQNLH